MSSKKNLIIYIKQISLIQIIVQLGGKNSETFLGSVGVEAGTEKVKKAIGELQEKTIDEIIAQGTEKLSSVPTVGAAVTERKERSQEKKKEGSASI